MFDEGAVGLAMVGRAGLRNSQSVIPAHHQLKRGRLMCLAYVKWLCRLTGGQIVLIATSAAAAGTDKPPVQLMEDVVLGKVSSS